MTTPIETLNTAIMTRIGENVKYPLAYDNVDVETLEVYKRRKMWIRAKIVYAENMQMDIGDDTKRFRIPGVIMFQIFVPENEGTGKGIQVADEIGGNFRCLTASSVTYKTPSVKNVGRDRGWYQINVSCPFYYDFYA